MKVIRIKKNKLLIFSSIFLTFIITFCTFSTSFGMQHYYKLDFSTCIVTASKLNVRSGPGTGYSIVATANKNDYIRVFAGVGDWYIVQVEGDYVGAVNKKYVKPIYPNNNTGNSNNSNNSSNTGSNSNTTSSNLSQDEKEVFDLINKQRTNNGLKALNIDSEVQKVARIKAQDMVNNNYFSHTSPTYGSPFDMLKKFSVSYKTAGENIAGNSSNSKAVEAWMNSEGHKANILNKSFKKSAIGFYYDPDSKWEYYWVELFTN